MTYHIVKLNDTLDHIALAYLVDKEEIKELNKFIKDWDHLLAGTKLRLPEISNNLNEEMDTYEPFMEEYYPIFNHEKYEKRDEELMNEKKAEDINKNEEKANVNKDSIKVNNGSNNNIYMNNNLKTPLPYYPYYYNPFYYPIRPIIPVRRPNTTRGKRR